jgi:hypothetical protein
MCFVLGLYFLYFFAFLFFNCLLFHCDDVFVHVASQSVQIIQDEFARLCSPPGFGDLERTAHNGASQTLQRAARGGFAARVDTILARAIGHRSLSNLGVCRGFEFNEFSAWHVYCLHVFLCVFLKQAGSSNRDHGPICCGFYSTPT